MSSIKDKRIQWDELTWPDVASLPRDLPIFLPLSNRLDPVNTKFFTTHSAILPPIPYGWPGSPIAVAPWLLNQLLSNLFRCLRLDGFQDLNLIHPVSLKFDIPGVHCHPVAIQSHPTPIKNLDRKHVVVISLGHTEQHGLHLPLNTDSVIIDAIARGISHSLPQSSTVLPTFPYGVSTHRYAFHGTFNLGGRIYEDFLLHVIGDLYARGADRFYLLNGHGGNHSFLVNVVKLAGERFPEAFTATAWLHTSGGIGSAALAKHRRSERGGMGHAGELETAMMLHLRPDLVHMDRVVDEINFISSKHYFMDWIEGGELIANPPWTDDTQTGSYGAGSLATTEHGRTWLEAAIEEKVRHLHDIHEQQNRRLARRSKRQQG